MIMMGTIVNAAAVVIGGAAGLIAKKAIKKNLQDSMMKTMGIAVVFLGISGTLSEMLVYDGNSGFEVRGTMLMILSLTLGIIAGELLKIEDGMEVLGEKLKKIFHADGDNLFVQGFVTNALVICVGAMAVVGSIQDGISGDPSTLYAKAVLDGMISAVFAASLGMGVLFAAIPLFIYQGLITLLAGWAAPFFTEEIIGNLSLVGYILISAVGVNLIFGKTFKVGNMLPALLFAVLSGILRFTV